MPLIFFQTLNEDQQQQIENIYHTYLNLIYATAKKYFPDESLAQEAVQNTFINLMQHLEKNNPNLCSKQPGYFVNIVKNTCIDMIRKQKKVPSTTPFTSTNGEGEEYILEIEDTASSIDHRMIQEEAYQRILGHIRALDDQYKIPLQLKLLHHMTEKEIAEALDLPAKTVNSRIYRGRQILIKKLKEEDYE